MSANRRSSSLIVGQSHRVAAMGQPHRGELAASSASESASMQAHKRNVLLTNTYSHDRDRHNQRPKCCHGTSFFFFCASSSSLILACSSLTARSSCRSYIIAGAVEAVPGNPSPGCTPNHSFTLYLHPRLGIASCSCSAHPSHEADPDLNPVLTRVPEM